MENRRTEDVCYTELFRALSVQTAELKLKQEFLEATVKSNEEVLSHLDISLKEMALNIVKLKYIIIGAIGLYVTQTFGIIEIIKKLFL